MEPTGRTLDVSPDWENLAAFFDQKAQEARRVGNDDAHTFWTQVAEQAENAELTPRETFRYVGLPADVEVSEE